MDTVIYKRPQIWILPIKNTKRHFINLTIITRLRIGDITMCHKVQQTAISAVIVVLRVHVWLVLMHVANALVAISFRAFENDWRMIGRG